MALILEFCTIISRFFSRTALVPDSTLRKFRWRKRTETTGRRVQQARYTMGGLIFKPVELACTVAYPAWQTYKSLEHADKHGGEVVIRQQLMYWLIFAMIHIVDSLFGFILQWASLVWSLRTPHIHTLTHALTHLARTHAQRHTHTTHTHARMEIWTRTYAHAVTRRSSRYTTDPHAPS